jgi:hypothetical protein
MLGEVFQRFAEKSPIAVMVRGVLERVPVNVKQVVASLVKLFF